MFSLSEALRHIRNYTFQRARDQQNFARAFESQVRGRHSYVCCPRPVSHRNTQCHYSTPTNHNLTGPETTGRLEHRRSEPYDEPQSKRMYSVLPTPTHRHPPSPPSPTLIQLYRPLPTDTPSVGDSKVPAYSVAIAPKAPQNQTATRCGTAVS